MYCHMTIAHMENLDWKIMNETEFINNVWEQLEDTPKETLTLSTRFEDIEEWCSLVGLSIMAMIQDYYNVKLTYNDLKSIHTIGDLYKFVSNKRNDK